jgi:NADH-quinone oxidoreductase subunit N
MALSLFIPETLTLVLAAVLFLFSLGKKETVSKWLHPYMLFSAAALVAGSFYALSFHGDTFFGTYRVDLLSQGFKVLLSVAFFCTILFSKDMISIDGSKRAEYFFFLFTGMLGMMMIASAAEILTLYIALELSAYSLYLLSALRPDRRNAEAGVKYLLFGAATSGVFLWGMSIVAGLSGSFSLLEIAAKAPALAAEPAFTLGVVLASFAFLFKLSGFPAHFWAPDVYESAATPVTNFIATASKAAAVAVLIRVFLLFGVSSPVVTILGGVAFVSMTLGNCVALVQKDVKRLLAYSSIAQAGYILVALLAGSPEGYSSIFFYAIAYVLMNTGAFLAVLLVAHSMKHDNPQIEHFDGLAERSPFLSLVLLVSLLSLAGIPPLVGFTGKWILFSAAMDKGHWFLVLWGVLNSVVSLFYYLTIVKHAYLEKPKTADPIRMPAPLVALGLALFGTILFLGIFPNSFITFAQNAIAAAAVIS